MINDRDQPRTPRRGTMPRLTVSPREAAEQTGSSKSFIAKCLKDGTLESSLVGGRRFIPVESLQRVFKTK